MSEDSIERTLGKLLAGVESIQKTLEAQANDNKQSFKDVDTRIDAAVGRILDLEMWRKEAKTWVAAVALAFTAIFHYIVPLIPSFFR